MHASEKNEADFVSAIAGQAMSTATALYCCCSKYNIIYKSTTLIKVNFPDCSLKSARRFVTKLRNVI